jgi:RimJ/RimL family protein N-acetyltransferase
VQIGIRPWVDGDRRHLAALNTPEMTEHLGGPESPDQLRDRLARYLAARGPSAWMFVVVDARTDERLGDVGYWEKTWHGQEVYETGWKVLPPHQGRGVATAALRLVVEHASIHCRRPALHAFPSVANAASNAICRKAGFQLLGAVDTEYPPGQPLTVNDWRLPLTRREDR